MEPGLKECSRCHKVRLHDEFHKNGVSPDGLYSICKPCKSVISRKNYEDRKTKDTVVNPKTLNSVMNALSAIERKTLDCLPYDEYASPAKVQGILIQRYGSKIENSKVLAILDGHAKRGLAIRSDGVLFSRLRFKAKEDTAVADTTEYADAVKVVTPVKEPKMQVETKKAPNLDGLRSITLKLLDMGKAFNTLADELDVQITAIEQKSAAGDAEMTKLRQLQALLKDLNA